MLSPLRNRFGIPGVISVIALVFAMFGGAYAASSNGGGKATASAKGRPGPRGPRGKTGPVGAAGAAGLAGAKGDTGAAGANGTNGAPGTNGVDGKTVLNGVATPTVGTGEVGDFYIKTATDEIFGPKAASGVNGGWGNGTELKGEEGKEGSPWTAGGTLPSEATETGAWWFAGNGNGVEASAISFPIPLSVADAASTTVHFWREEVGKEDPECPGTPDAPAAEPGAFCVYIAKEATNSVENPKVFKPDFGNEGIGTSGALLSFESLPTSAYEGGSFAITAP
jgi:hypothetical protein